MPAGGRDLDGRRGAWRRPECACPVSAAYRRRLNDASPDDERQRLKKFVPLLVNGRTAAGIQLTRAEFLTRAACIEVLPPALELLKDEEWQAIAKRLRGMTGASSPIFVP